jgi:hypothetical protein
MTTLPIPSDYSKSRDIYSSPEITPAMEAPLHVNSIKIGVEALEELTRVICLTGEDLAELRSARCFINLILERNSGA